MESIAAVPRVERLRESFPALAGLLSTPAVPSAKPDAIQLRGFAAGQFADGYRIASGNAQIVLRPELSRVPGVQSFRSGDGDQAAEIFVAHDATAARGIAYRVTSAPGIVEIVSSGQGVRFIRQQGRDILLS